MSSPISAVSQMLERNQALFVGKRLLVCGALEDDYPRQLASLARTLTVFTTDYCYYRSQQAALGEAILFDHQLGGAPRFDALLLLMPKAKAEAQYLLAMMTPLLEAGADLFLAGEITPVFFGTALGNFGVDHMLDGLVEWAPLPLS